eukprot:gb/GEZN01003996.1/.p1 GENE.gb/GEZN01003996.1/~~gb/GEZN01003996.1/.p1  ORF type:complete len:641 (-),score=35.81 gb/GEZN01003996.1/:33-1955(-)
MICFFVALWTCLLRLVYAQNSCAPATRVRTAWRTWPCDRRDQFFYSLAQMRDNGGLRELALLHVDAACYAHNEVAFLAWHRDFLVTFEDKLRATAGGACLTVPYWDWEVDADFAASNIWDRIPILSPKYFGNRTNIDGGTRVNVSPINTFQDYDAINRRDNDPRIRRDFGSTTVSSISRVLAVIQNNVDFRTFASELEGSPHVNMHFFYGGTMSTFGSPADVVFYVHHANVDRIWAMWQIYHGFGNNGLNRQFEYPDNIAMGQPGFATSNNRDGSNGCGDRVFFNSRLRFSNSGRTLRDTVSIQLLGYAYGPDQLIPLLPASVLPRFQTTPWFQLNSPKVEIACCGDNILSAGETCDDGNPLGDCVLSRQCGARNVCENNNCNGRGTCSPSIGKCICKEGYRGDKCEIDDCAAVVCLNGGECRRAAGAFCWCPLGFTGVSCETSTCLTRNCGSGQRQGSCQVSTLGVASCICPVGVTGANCERDICATINCLHGGTCVLTGNTAQCRCAPTYGGDTCEHRVCADNYCNVEGTLNACQAGVCVCSTEWGGAECNEPIILPTPSSSKSPSSSMSPSLSPSLSKSLAPLPSPSQATTRSISTGIGEDKGQISAVLTRFLKSGDFEKILPMGGGSPRKILRVFD